MLHTRLHESPQYIVALRFYDTVKKGGFANIYIYIYIAADLAQ